MKKLVLFFFLLLLTCHFSFSQIPLAKQWDARFGGYENETLTALKSTTDGGYILGGYSSSDSSGNKTQQSRGDDDYFLVKVDSAGHEQWNVRFGGQSTDELADIEQTADKGYVMVGTSSSNAGGDKTENPRGGSADYWVVKIDSSGNKQWDKTLGGFYEDFGTSVSQTADGGYIVGGYSSSFATGDKTQTNYNTDFLAFDYWIIRLDSRGNKLWDKTLGGYNDDFLSSVQQTADGGYILGGYSNSDKIDDKSDYRRNENMGGPDLYYFDFWIVKTDSSGNKQWDKTFGGDMDEDCHSMVQTRDKGYIMAGLSYSGANGDKSQPLKVATNGFSDYWVLKIDSLGNKQWDKDYGGSDDQDDFGNIVETKDHGYLLSGTSVSPIGIDKSENNLGPEQGWALKIDSVGNKQWDKTMLTPNNGGNDDEMCFCAQGTDGGYTFANYTYGGIGGDKSQDGWYTVPLEPDYWIVKFKDTSNTRCSAPYAGIVTQSKDTICNGTGIIDVLTSRGSAGTIQWQSSTDSVHFAMVASSDTAYQTSRSLSQTTTYRAIASNNCGSDTSGWVTLFIVPSPVASFNYNLTGFQAVFNADSTSSDVVNYSWDFGDGITSNLKNPAHTFPGDDTYYVCLTVYNNSNCSFTLCRYIDTDVKDLIATITPGDIQLYPNPASQTLHLSLDGLAGSYRLRIYNVMGQPVFEFNDNQQQLLPKQMLIPLNNMPSGTYQVVITNANKVYTKRFVHTE